MRVGFGFVAIAIIALPAITENALAQDVMRGRDLMTSEERQQARSEMFNAKTQEERDAVRTRHQEEMQSRAAEKGAKLPYESGPSGRGYGPGVGGPPMMQGPMGGGWPGKGQ